MCVHMGYISHIEQACVYLHTINSCSLFHSLTLGLLCLVWVYTLFLFASCAEWMIKCCIPAQCTTFCLLLFIEVLFFHDQRPVQFGPGTCWGKGHFVSLQLTECLAVGSCQFVFWYLSLKSLFDSLFPAMVKLLFPVGYTHYLSRTH